MGLFDFWGQKSRLDEIQNDLANMKLYVSHVSNCIGEIDACWVGNKDKQKVVNAIVSHLHGVNNANSNLNVFKQTATFVLVKMNELGSLVGFNAPAVSQLSLPGIFDNFRLNPRIQIETTALRAVADKIEGDRKYLEETSFSITNTKNIIDIIILNLFGLNNLLKSLDKHVAEQKAENQRIVNGIRQICDLYESTEKRLTQKIGAITGLGVAAAVTAPTSATTQTSNGVVKLDVPAAIRYKQTDYPKFLLDGVNVGCSATALATCVAYIRGNNYSPTEVSWGYYGTNNEYVGVLSWLPGKPDNYNEADKYAKIYESLLNNKPSIIRVNVSSHYVSVIGINEGADINNLQTKDFIVIDPQDGQDKMLSNFTQVNPGQLITF